MRLTSDHLLEIQHDMAGATATADQIRNEGKRIAQRHRALAARFHALKARLDAATLHAGAAGDTDAEVIAARADLHGTGGHLVQEMLREEAKMNALSDRLAPVEAEVAEVALLLDLAAPQRGALRFAMLLLVVLAFAELAGVPVIETIRRGLEG